MALTVEIYVEMKKILDDLKAAGKPVEGQFQIIQVLLDLNDRLKALEKK
jgi:hypothetical protein